MKFIKELQLHTELETLPGGIVIDAVGTLPFLAQKVDINWEEKSIVIDNGKANFKSYLTAEELAICCYAVWYGESENNMGAISQTESVGIPTDSIVAWHLMIADGYLGEVVYGVGCHGHICDSEVDGYQNPFLREVDSVLQFNPTSVSNLVDEFYSESIYQVFLNYNTLSFKLNNTQLVPKIEFNAVFGAKRTEQSVLKDGDEAIRRYPLIWEALQHFVKNYSQYEHKYKSFLRVKQYAILVGLFRRLKKDGAELKCGEAIEKLYKTREPKSIPWASYAIRHKSFSQLTHNVSIKLYKKLRNAQSVPEKNHSLLFKISTLGMQYSQQCGDPELFYFFKLNTQISLEHLSETDLPGTYEKVRDFIHPLIHDQIIYPCFYVASKIIKNEDALYFKNKALDHIQKGFPYASALDLPHLILQEGEGLYLLKEFEQAHDCFSLSQNLFSDLKQYKWAAYCADNCGNVLLEIATRQSDDDSAQDAYENAREQFEAARKLYQEINYVAQCYCKIAYVHIQLSDWHLAIDTIEKVGQLYQTINDPAVIVKCANECKKYLQMIGEKADGDEQIDALGKINYHDYVYSAVSVNSEVNIQEILANYHSKSAENYIKNKDWQGLKKAIEQAYLFRKSSTQTQETISSHTSIQNLQKDTVTLLNSIQDLMFRAVQLMGSKPSESKYNKFQEEIKIAKENVEQLKLVMSVVAPMKAGKSTIISTIMGEDILPSRASAMTTLPTEITFLSEQSQPELVLDDNTFSLFNDIISTLQEKINAIKIDEVFAKLKEYPHLHDFAPKIQEGFSIAQKTVGQENIKNTLTHLNDLLRFYSALDLPTDIFNKKDIDIPKIYTPLQPLQKEVNTNQSELIGSLAIVDTPGPNEAGKNLQLSAVVEDRLRKSSMVLIVLDYTQLNTKAAEEIKRQVQQVVQLLGKENLYVLVNKVDQRREGDPMTPERVKQFVSADLELDQPSDADRVFEVSALWAFHSKNFLSELERYPDLKKEDMRTARAFAEIALGSDWEEDFEEISLKQLEKKANRLWKKSGFESFLENAIEILMKDAAPRCINSALNLSRNRLEELRDNIELRSAAIASDEEKISLQIEALNQDIKDIEDNSLKLEEVAQIRETSEKNIQKILEKLRKVTRDSLEWDFKKKSNEQTNLVQKLSIMTTRITEFWRFDNTFSQWMQETLLPYGLNTDNFNGILEFKSNKDAEEFKERVTNRAFQEVERILPILLNELLTQCNQSIVEINTVLINDTKPIIDRARSRLNRTFNSELSLKPPIFDEIDIDKERVDSPIVVEEKILWKNSVKNIFADVFNFFRQIFNYPPKDVYLKGTEVSYKVSIDTITEQIYQSVEKCLSEIESKINDFLNNETKENVNQFFDSLSSFLDNYKDSLEQAQEDIQLTVENKDALIVKLLSFLPEVEEQIEKCNTYSESPVSNDTE